MVGSNVTFTNDMYPKSKNEDWKLLRRMVINIYLSRLEGEGTYDQNASYMIAFCFLIALFSLRYHDYYPKFSFLDKKWFRIFKYCLFPYLIVMAFPRSPNSRISIM